VGGEVRIGIAGVGTISDAYLRTLPRLRNVRVVAVADLDHARAEVVAAHRHGVRAATTSELYTADDIDLVLNLTTPGAHAEVALAAIAGGKHVYGEKPLALNTAEGREILDTAAEAGVRVGCAPDTVLGTGVQTARVSLDSGAIGTPFAASAFMVTPGHERWHPAPEFYYREGGGPLMDMGPYYLTALITLLGPVRRVTGMAATPRPVRTIGSGPLAGSGFGVEVATHITGVLEHAGGALSTLIMSFDVWAGHLPRIEVYGTEGTLAVPDPNGFDGTVQVYRSDGPMWTDLREAGGYPGAARGFGVSDMARAIEGGTPHRASGELAYHVLDVMESLLAAVDSGNAVEVASRCERPAAVAHSARPEGE
jgi:predicted dehydrogenase